uniref:alpha-1,2-Mannosidase n=1 Tax=Odontella aurita TaxID=265563 RepID=A0A7S4K3S5_9STRA
MESFFLAETLKYLYLLQDPDTTVDILGKHVFNTEAHPLRLLDQVERRDVCKAQSFPHLSEAPKKDHDFASFEPLGGDRFPEYKEGRSPYNITLLVKNQSDKVARSRREHIKSAMKHAWNGYRTYAFGKDELMPHSKKGRDAWGGMGTTLVDSLDTLWLMGLKEEFAEGRDWVRDHLDHDKVGKVSVFETAIRSLGGLLSAFDLSGDEAFLVQADDLGSRLMVAFDTPSGLPYAQVDLSTGKASDFHWLPNKAILAEFGTLQIEFRYLAKVTGAKEYAKKAERIYDLLHSLQPDNGLLPLYFQHSDANPKKGSGKVSFGAMGDSVYEYFLKVWLQGGKKEEKYREMYDKSIQGLHDELVHTSQPSGLTYIAERSGAKLDHKMDHLVCFLSGTLALGAYTDPQGLNSSRAQRDLQTARALAYTCHQMYARQATGISPEIVKFIGNEDFEATTRDSFYILRPEAVESFFVLNQLTGDPIYREWGWEIFQSIERYCRTDIAYGSLQNVNKPNDRPMDKMESFFLAETLKYLYLLQDPDTYIDVLKKHVFNTEAHPLRLLEKVDRNVNIVSSLDTTPNRNSQKSVKAASRYSYDKFKDGLSPYNITNLIKLRSDKVGRGRRKEVKAAMHHAWNGYKRYAYGMDELKPKSKRGQNNLGGMGTTLVDSLSTLWLMGMKNEFYKARDWVRDRLDHDNIDEVSVFETTIRNMGGLLSAYDLSGDDVFLVKADDLGSRLLNAFDSPSGIPFSEVELKTGKAKNRPQVPKATLLAECGTLQVEFRYLARATGNTSYAEKAERVHKILASMQPESGLIPVNVKNTQEEAEFGKGPIISFGSLGGSAYEYLLKVWLQGGRQESERIYRDMYDKAIQGLHDELLLKSNPSGLTYVAEMQSSVVKKRMDHLVCFLGGTLALGAYTDPRGLHSDRAQRDLRTGKALAYTCYQMYDQTLIGIAPEAVSSDGEDLEHVKGSDFYLPRPEAIESFYILHQLTGDPVYRDWGYNIFQSIQRHCKTSIAYDGLHRVDSMNATSEDRMESFFLAGTLKYLYLLFDPDTKLDILNEYVFNTEAHPLRMFTKLPDRKG